jgi:hypothetical protein
MLVGSSRSCELYNLALVCYFSFALYVRSVLFLEPGLRCLSWSDLSSIAFDPNYALFKNTEGNQMYPNPVSKFVHGSDDIVLFEFLGRILGKAIYESSKKSISLRIPRFVRPSHTLFDRDLFL